MPSPSPLTRVARELVERGRVPSPTSRTIELLATAPGGAPIDPSSAAGMSFNDMLKLEAAYPIVRRESLGSLFDKGRLTSVHESGRSKAAGHAGGLDNRERYLRTRSKVEQSLFGYAPEELERGEGPVYGYLTTSPEIAAEAPLEMLYPDSGSIIRPASAVAQYGRYGLMPKRHVRERTTFTPGDSIDDQNIGGLRFDELFKDKDRLPMELHGDSALAQLARERAALYKDALRQAIEAYEPGKGYTSLEQVPWSSRYDVGQRAGQLMSEPFEAWLQRHGLGMTRDGGIPRAAARALSDPLGRDKQFYFAPHEARGFTTPLDHPTNGSFYDAYTEAQIHGPLTLDDIDAVYDFGVEPSRATEKKLRQLGIDYRPVVQPEAPLAVLRRALAAKPSFEDFVRSTEPYDQVFRELNSWKKRDEPPKVARNYSQGGAA